MKKIILRFIMAICREQIKKHDEMEKQIGMGGKAVWVKRKK